MINQLNALTAVPPGRVLTCAIEVSSSPQIRSSRPSMPPCCWLDFFVSIFGNPQIGRWLYLASAVIGGVPLFWSAGKAILLQRDVTAGFMASVALIAAMIVGEYSAAAVVVFMFTTGDWLENLTVARANDALRDLASLVPAIVTILREGQETVVPITQVVSGDIVLVRSGERIGVDGVIRDGSASINQSAITGESMPVDKKTGDEVFAGTLNEVGLLEIEVTRVGVDTTLGQIVKLVGDAQQPQAPVQRVANQYARLLVPATFLIAGLVYLLTGDILRAITVLVVVCPCALVLATPTAVAAAIGNAAKRGMLVKSGAVIEQIGKVNVVAFDKTGTLTYGKPTLQQVIPLDGTPEEQILAYAASLERGSEHPIGRAIVQAGSERQVEFAGVTGFNVLPGYGVTGRVNDSEVIVGSRALLNEHKITWSASTDRQLEQIESQGQTVIPVAVDGTLRGLIALADTPRPEARRTIAALKKAGIREILMITGDNARTANRMAQEFGIERIYAEVLPQDKLEIMRAYQAQGKKVAFVGDGVNDAPALAAADIGIAMGLGGTDVALETADIGLMADEIERIPQIIDLSCRTLGVIRQNVIFSMSMNVLAVLLSGFGLIGPVVGALMHEASALPVVVNSARLINTRQADIR